MENSAAQARAIIKGEPIGFEELLLLLAALKGQGEFRLGLELVERAASFFPEEQQRQLRECSVALSDCELAALLDQTLSSAETLEAPFAVLEREEALAPQWRHARRVVSKLRDQGRPRDDAELQRWRMRHQQAARKLGTRVAQRPESVAPAELELLVRDLKATLDFGTARTIIQNAREVLPQGKREWFWQQFALCTYKDEELIPRERFQCALDILDEIPGVVTERMNQPESSETLGLRGAIYKRMWEHGGQVENLYRAANNYLHAWMQDKKSDMGYGGINAAFLMDVLGNLEKPVLGNSEASGNLQEGWSARARELREEMRQELPGMADAGSLGQYWFRVTMAEINWGLGEWSEAGKWLALARQNDTSEWELQTTVKQLVSLARLRGVGALLEDQPQSQWHPAWQALRELVGDDIPSVVTCYRGKVGLALSGGGFRASLFHLGVLARLSEMDVLRGVEVLSTVSGGSIVGAHYYLALRKLAQEHPDRDLRADDYVELVKGIQEDFLQAIQKNLRTRGLSNLVCNLRFMLPGSYTRSNRMGELYEEYIYSQVKDDHEQAKPRILKNLLIHPCIDRSEGTCKRDDQFNPKFSNWRRRAKVPVLLLNTTSLNTGHNWQFTARWMGEPPGLLGPEAETIPRYRRLWYDEAPSEELRNYRLGYAVAASACVPALFEPLELRNLYPGRTVRLVDGGVHDNQGVAGLLDESCTLILCSDGSGQMGDNPQPSNSILGVPLRSNSILMDRVREAEYLDIKSRVDSHALQGLFFVHLKQELSQEPITWLGGSIKEYDPKTTTTSYRVDRDLQGKLAAIRTDLDSFSEVEAYALMSSGYLMTKREFERLDEEHVRRGAVGTWSDFAVHVPSRGVEYWKFLELAPIMQRPHDDPDLRRADLGRQLDAGASRFLKAFGLSPMLGAVGFALIALIAVSLAYLVFRNWKTVIETRVTVGGILLTLLLIAGGMIWRLGRIANPEAVMRSWILKGMLAFGGWIMTNLHLRLIDPVFLRRGRLDRLMKLPPQK